MTKLVTAAERVGARTPTGTHRTILLAHICFALCITGVLVLDLTPLWWPNPLGGASLRTSSVPSPRLPSQSFRLGFRVSDTTSPISCGGAQRSVKPVLSCAAG